MNVRSNVRLLCCVPVIWLACSGSATETTTVPTDGGADTTVPQDASPPEGGADTGSVEAGDATIPDGDPVDVPDVVEPVMDPFQPPADPVATWSGKLPPGGLLDRDIEVTFPGDPAVQPLPLVVFAHGFQLGVRDYTATLQHIAKFGYVVASVDYRLGLNPRHHAVVESLVAGVDLLTQQPPPELAGRIDSGRIAAMGHSLGGKGAVWAALENAGFKAVLALDPVDDDPSPLGGPSPDRPSITPELMTGMQVPALYMAAQLSPGGAVACAPWASNACRFFESTPGGIDSWLVGLEQFGHLQFLDNYNCLSCFVCVRGPEAEHGASQIVARGLMVAFLGYALKDQTGYLSYLNGVELDELRTNNRVLDQTEQDAFCTAP